MFNLKILYTHSLVDHYFKYTNFTKNNVFLVKFKKRIYTQKYFCLLFEKRTLHTYLKKDHYFKYTQHLKKYFWLSLKKKYTHIF